MPQIPYRSKDLRAPHRPRWLSGSSLSEVAFPLGGIGTGAISLGGRGDLRDWEIFNHPSKGLSLPLSFFALWTRTQGAKPVARILEGRLKPPYKAVMTQLKYVSTNQLAQPLVHGLPRFEEARFRGEYPLAWVELMDPEIPVTASLKAFNPMIPLDEEASGLPLVFFHWSFRNNSKKTVDLSLAASLINAAGYDGASYLYQTTCSLFGQNLNSWKEEGGTKGLSMTTAKAKAGEATQGSMALATTWKKTGYQARMNRRGWYDEIQGFWDEFSATGSCQKLPDEGPTPEGRTDVGVMALKASLKPGETVEMPLVMAWHFPTRLNTWNTEEAVKGKALKNYYAVAHADAWAVAQYGLKNLPSLQEGTVAYHKALFGSTLPSVVLDAASSQASIIRTNTCMRLEDGSFHAFEGCNTNEGCCPMNCSHVWNYEQALAYLYPALERTMRETDFLFNTKPDGFQGFRTLLPLSAGAIWSWHPAADGQLGNVMKLYREWQLSGDTAWLRRLWPMAKRSLEYAWEKWDMDRDGVMEGQQHNTYDIEFYGGNTFTGLFYLGALKTGALMAEAVGEPEAAKLLLEVFQKGQANLEKGLWNGEFYIQKVPPDKATQGYQCGPGCLSDQILGQWFANVLNLGPLLEPKRLRKATASIFKYNWKDRLGAIANIQRVYAVNEEAGLLLCSWPRGGRPEFPFPYCDEVWTGIEYQVAAQLLYEGFLDEGLAVVKGVRDRYAGHNRNPWNEIECGDHYARAMASWSLVLALSGFHYSGISREIKFNPKVNQNDFRTFWSCGSAWGHYSRKEKGKRASHTLAVERGELRLKSVELSSSRPLRAQAGGKTLPGFSQVKKGLCRYEFSEEICVRPDSPLVLASL